MQSQIGKHGRTNKLGQAKTPFTPLFIAPAFV
jgi:hypothetical protein